MIIRILMLSCISLLISACSEDTFDLNNLSKVYPRDFHSDKPDECSASDVNLNHTQAYEFFSRAKIVSVKTIHDQFEHASCYLKGTLIYKNKSCDWEIRAGSTGSIKCDDEVLLFACSDCDDLFTPSSKP